MSSKTSTATSLNRIFSFSRLLHRIKHPKIYILIQSMQVQLWKQKLFTILFLSWWWCVAYVVKHAKAALCNEWNWHSTFMHPNFFYRLMSYYTQFYQFVNKVNDSAEEQMPTFLKSCVLFGNTNSYVNDWYGPYQTEPLPRNLLQLLFAFKQFLIFSERILQDDCCNSHQKKVKDQFMIK